MKRKVKLKIKKKRYKNEPFLGKTGNILGKTKRSKKISENL